MSQRLPRCVANRSSAASDVLSEAISRYYGWVETTLRTRHMPRVTRGDSQPAGPRERSAIKIRTAAAMCSARPGADIGLRGAMRFMKPPRPPIRPPVNVRRTYGVASAYLSSLARRGRGTSVLATKTAACGVTPPRTGASRAAAPGPPFALARGARVGRVSPAAVGSLRELAMPHICSSDVVTFIDQAFKTPETRP